MENFTRRVAGWFLLCLAMSMSLSAAAQQPPVERVDVETIPVQDDLEEMVIESQPESTNHPKQEKDVDTDDDDRAAAVRTDAGQDENVGQGELSQKDRRRDKGDGRENDDEDDDEVDSVDYGEKLTEILRSNSIKSIKVVRMEVPCCGGIENAVKDALQRSGKFIPWQVVTLSTDGRILAD